MLYRNFGTLDWQVSALGFGAMRLPLVADDPAQIDEDEALRMLHYAIDRGVNYVDTAHPYHRGKSEEFLGRALRGSYRERVRLATKLPLPKVKTAEDFDRFFDEQRARLQMGRVDFYLLHALNESHWPRLRDLGVLDWAEKKMAEGSIGHLGFSFHDKYELFQRIIDDYDGWTFCQIQYNYMDEEYQAGTKGLEYAAEKGLAVVVMEPIRGGALARNLPPAVQALWDSSPARRTPAAWALEWVWNHLQVSVVLSGMSTMEQVEENLVTADQSAPPTLTDEEVQIVARVRDTYRDLCPIPCTSCGYCIPCPSNINIPRIFEIYNDRVMYTDDQRAQMIYSWISEDERANMCAACGECLEKCPQGLEIPDWLEKAHQVLCEEEEPSA